MNVKNMIYVAMIVCFAIVGIDAKFRPYINRLGENSWIKKECNLCEEARIFRGDKEKACDRQEAFLEKVAREGNTGQENIILWWLTLPIGMVMSLVFRDADMIDRDIKWTSRRDEHEKDIKTILGFASDREYRELEKLAITLRREYVIEERAKSEKLAKAKEQKANQELDAAIAKQDELQTKAILTVQRATKQKR